MTWATLIPIIVNYGLPVAEALFQKWKANAEPTQADFDDLRALANQTAKDRLILALNNAGIALDSPEALALIAKLSN